MFDALDIHGVGILLSMNYLYFYSQILWALDFSCSIQYALYRKSVRVRLILFVLVCIITREVKVLLQE